MNRAFNLNPYVRLVPAGDFFTTLSDTESPGLWPTSGVARLWQVHLGRNPDAPVFAFAFFAKKRANRKEIVDLYYDLRDRYSCCDDEHPKDTKRYQDAMLKICGSSNVPRNWC